MDDRERIRRGPEATIASSSDTSDTLLLCDIGFHREGEALDWRVVFVPTQGMQDAMQQSLHAAL